MPSRQQDWRPGVIWPDVCVRLRDFYAALRGHFGYQPRWWPGTPWEMTLSAILVQQCDWTVAHRGLRQLVAAGIDDIASLTAARAGDVQDCIRSIAFAPTKAGRLIAFAQHLRTRGFDRVEAYLSSAETDVLRNDLLSLAGIGHETADAILLFAGDSHATFVIDAYTRRILVRTRLHASLDDAFWKRPAPVLRAFLQQHLLASLDQYDAFEWDESVPREVAVMRDYHAQLVELGRHHCLKSKPRCHATGKHGWAGYDFCRDHCLAANCTACPLSEMCRYATPPIEPRD